MKSNKTLQTQAIRTYIESCLNIDISKRTRKRNYVYARAVYFKLCREYTKLSLDDIGQTVDMDHASVVHAISKVFDAVVFHDKFLEDIYNDYKLSNKNTNETIFDNYERLLKENLDLRREVESIKEESLFDRRFIDLYQDIPFEKRTHVYEKLEAIVKVTKAFYERDTV